MQQAIWYARRMEPACPPVHQQPKSYFPQGRRQVQFDYPKSTPAPPVSTANNPATIIQQARMQGIYYKCKEPWFLGHKQVSKLANKVQIQALQAQANEEPEIIYITTNTEDQES